MEYEVKRYKDFVGCDCIVVTHCDVVILSYAISYHTAEEIISNLSPVLGDVSVEVKRLMSY